MKTKLFIAAFALILSTTLVNAQDTTPGGQKLLNGTGRGHAYVDVNKNNVCDNFENGTPGTQVNANFRGRGQGQGNCWAQNGRGPGNGRGQGYGCGQGGGRKFVDADKNGICDYNEPATKK